MRAGRFGPYVNRGKVNATLPKSMTAEDVTLEDAIELIEEKGGPPKKKAPAKKAPAKKAAKPKKAIADSDETPFEDAKPVKAAAKKAPAKKAAAKKAARGRSPRKQPRHRDRSRAIQATRGSDRAAALLAMRTRLHRAHGGILVQAISLEKSSARPRPGHRATLAIKTAPQPTREDILAFIAREREAAGPRKIGMREIARAFGIKGDDRVALKRMLATLADEGAIEKRGKRVNRKGALPPVTLVDIIGRDRDGELDRRAGRMGRGRARPAPRASSSSRRAAPGRGEPLPGVGDRALVRAEPDRDAGPGEPPYVGRVVKLLSRARHRVLGVLRDRAERRRPHRADRQEAGGPRTRRRRGRYWRRPGRRSRLASISSARRASARRAPGCARRSAP